MKFPPLGRYVSVGGVMRAECSPRIPRTNSILLTPFHNVRCRELTDGALESGNLDLYKQDYDNLHNLIGGYQHHHKASPRWNVAPC